MYILHNIYLCSDYEGVRDELVLILSLNLKRYENCWSRVIWAQNGLAYAALSFLFVFR